MTVKFVASVAVAALPVVFWFRVATLAAIVPDAMFEPLRLVKFEPLPKFVAVTSPVILILPVPVIFLLFKSRFPPATESYPEQYQIYLYHRHHL